MRSSVNAVKEHFKIKGQGGGAVKVIHRKKKIHMQLCEQGRKCWTIRSLFLA